jgi:anti-sigma B factor antagonist
MSAENHDYKTRRAGPQTIITMPTEIDAANADQVRQALLSAASPDVTVLIIDMSGTIFCDSAGVHAIIAAYRQAAAAGTQLRLVTTSVLRIFQMTGADQLIPIYPTLDAAQAAHK